MNTFAGYTAFRLAAAIPTLFGVSLVAFLMVHLALGDPLATLTQGYASEAALQQLRAYYGFDRSLPEQYLNWLGEIIRGNFGISVTTGQQVATGVWEAFGNSLILAVPAALLSILGGWLLGSHAVFSNRWANRVYSGLFIAFIAMPSYWFGMLLVALFSVMLGLLPAIGMGGLDSFFDLATRDGLAHAILPVVTLAITPAGILARSTKSILEDVSERDFVLALRARGLSETRVRRAIQRNAMPSLTALYGLQIGYLLGGVILIEIVFAWPGIGVFLATAIEQRDLPSIQAALLVTAIAFVALNLAADLLQAIVDPRIRR